MPASVDLPLDALPPGDADRLRAVALMMAVGGCSYATAAKRVGSHQDCEYPGNALRNWCCYRAQAWAEVRAWAEQEVAPELERRARQILYGAMDGQGTLDQQLKAAQIVLSDRRRSEEIAVRRELLSAKLQLTIIDPFERIPEERRAELAASPVLAERGLRLIEGES